MVETDPYVGLDQVQIYQIKVPFGDVKPMSETFLTWPWKR